MGAGGRMEGGHVHQLYFGLGQIGFADTLTCLLGPDLVRNVHSKNPPLTAPRPCKFYDGDIFALAADMDRSCSPDCGAANSDA